MCDYLDKCIISFHCINYFKEFDNLYVLVSDFSSHVLKGVCGWHVLKMIEPYPSYLRMGLSIWWHTGLVRRFTIFFVVHLLVMFNLHKILVYNILLSGKASYLGGGSSWKTLKESHRDNGKGSKSVQRAQVGVSLLSFLLAWGVSLLSFLLACVHRTLLFWKPV